MWKKLWGELRNHSGKNHDLSRAKRDYLPLIPRVWVMNDVFDEANICNKHSPPLLLCTRAPGRRRALGGSLARRQQQNPPPKEPRKRRQRAPSWATAPLANSLGTRSVWSSRRGRTLRNHSWLLAEREGGSLPTSGQMCRALEIPARSISGSIQGGWKPSWPTEFLSLGPLWARGSAAIPGTIPITIPITIPARVLTWTKLPQPLKTEIKSEVMTNNELCGGEQSLKPERFELSPAALQVLCHVHQNLAKISILGLIWYRTEEDGTQNFLQK